ncbi:DsbA family oxidoreductase [Vibrio sp. RM-69-4]|uniref:DsbA family oxidoreductase n=1 Tax=Vibrio sp. RM-69-4 TaxID=2950157 RepID=UPI00215CA4EC|nr:DsbA family oxidoreductase [Vibrio sp. RM-69-4]MCR9423924.1 DsbA family oxidoreductase [Vibrio sp. RM-69-4]
MPIAVGKKMKKLRIDIVSDVVCPWCIIGYKRLEQALLALSDTIDADIHWHPFELNPAMPVGGEHLQQHLAKKYGTSIEASLQARQTLSALGQEVGFQFNFSDDMRIYNTRKAHQLLMWANSQGKQLELEMALFRAYFTFGQALDDDDVLLDLVQSLGLDREICRAVLTDESWAKTVSVTEQQWLEAGIQAVPALIIEQRHLISGAQTTEILQQALEDIAQQLPMTQ